MSDSHRCIQKARQVLAALLLPALVACGTDGGTPVGSLRFGQIGEVRVDVRVPLIVVSGTNLSIEGELQQVLTWNSTGPWQIYESVGYRGRVGDEAILRSQGNPSVFSSAYASLITQLDGTPELKLSVADESLEVDCLEDGVESRSRVSVQIRDEPSGVTKRWTRCAEGSLEELTPVGAGPDTSAARVIQAAILTLQFSAGLEYHSQYLGTLPYGTLDRGENSPAEPEVPLIFRHGVGPNTSATPAADFASFWSLHSPGTSPPEVNWEDEMVLVGAIGEVAEAGDSVEIRRVVQDALGTTLIELVERVPGDFCSPAARRQFPFHIVVAPLSDLIVRFSNPSVERVSCGI